MQPQKTKILILAASPENLTRLRLGEELREINAGLRRAKYRDEFQLEYRSAVRPFDLQEAILEVEPQIVHFCGHGAGEEGILLEDQNGRSSSVSTTALANLFGLFADKVKCVVLNSCHTEHQAKAISEHIRYVVGMKREIEDRAAICFAVGFYCALAAGHQIEFSYQLGRNSIELANLPDHLNPSLLLRADDGEGLLPLPILRSPAVSALCHSLARMSREEMQVILSEYKAKTLVAPDDANVQFSLGLVYLTMRMYELAMRQFEKVLEVAPYLADAYFYYALASIRGRRLGSISFQEIQKIEKQLAIAMSLDERPAKFYYLAAILKHEVYFGKGLKVPAPGHDELLRTAATKEYEPEEIQRIVEAVPLKDPRLLRLIYRQP